MKSPGKSAQLQIRVTEAQKAAIARKARAAGLDMSNYLLSRALPDASGRFESIWSACCRENDTHRFALAEMNQLLSSLSAAELGDAVTTRPPAMPSAATGNYMAAMIETACARRSIAAPAWLQTITPLHEPLFGSALPGLRLYLLTNSPPAFRRRNIFIDSSIGAQV